MRQNNIIFFQNTELSGNADKPGLLDIFHIHLHEFKSGSLFSKTQVIVPNHAFASWLRDQITRRDNICANLDFVVLVGTVVENIYLANNPDTVLFDFTQAKHIIYNYLVNNQDIIAATDELSNYIFNDGVLDRFRAYQLASQLQQIFHEYLYLRTHELLNLDNSKLPEWQRQIFSHFLKAIDQQKTYLDVYQYFSRLDLQLSDLKLPEKLFIFGLTSIYPSQLEILMKLSLVVPIYWYYQPCSYDYYGDLLSTKARASLEKKLLRKPDLSLDDLYLTDGNPLLANLGQQSREFIELLNANEIEVFSLGSKLNDSLLTSKSMLAILQDDIRNLQYRVRHEYRLKQNSEFYTDPLLLIDSKNDDSCFHDLPNQQNSIKINVCHSRMREVQVLFNELADILNHNPKLKLDDILVTAPDIDDYAAYITAVFENEEVRTITGKNLKLPYAVTGNRQQNTYKILETLKLLLNLPYELPASYFLELLMQAEFQSGLGISNEDVELVKWWLAENNINFGFDGNDYAKYGYIDYSVHSFQAFLQNLVLGACLTETILIDNYGIPVYPDNDQVFVPYDNLDNAQINLCNKLIILIDILIHARELFYIDKNTYRELAIEEISQFLNELSQRLFNDSESELILQRFMGGFLALPVDMIINLPILNQMIDEFVTEIKSKIRFEGKINCASLQYVRNIPHQVIYILGLNFGEFPSSYQPNQLSMLSQEWYLADRNYNIEDKQIFLDTILAARHQLILSYIGRKETDNSEIKPSPLLSLFINTLGQSFVNFWDSSDPLKLNYNFKNIVCQHPLHPFYNNDKINYSWFWHSLAQVTGEVAVDLRWDFKQPSLIRLTLEQQQRYYQLRLKGLVDTFCYTNTNLYKIIGLSVFDNEIELQDQESLSILDNRLAKALFPFFKRFMGKVEIVQLQQYLKAKGILAYQHIGQLQFDHYLAQYQLYQEHCVKTPVTFYFEHTLTRGDEMIKLTITDEVMVENSSIIISDSFERISNKELPAKLENVAYALRIKALLLSLIVNSKQFTLADNRAIDGIIIRVLRSNGEIRDFKVWADSSQLGIDRLIKYYLRSLTNPVLIHRGAISEYAKKSNELDRKGNPKNTIQDCVFAAKAKYLADFQNYELDNLRQDVVFANIVDDYFDFMEEVNSLNDIIRIGEILATLRG